VKVNDRIVRMAQEQTGRALRSAKWRAEVTAGVLAAWPADPAKRTADEWDAVRVAIPGGEYLPSSVIKGRTRQITRFQATHGRMPRDVFELEPAPRVARMLLLAACDGQQATIERSPQKPTGVLLRLQLPIRPDPHSYADWSWVACPITLPPTVPDRAVVHLPTLRIVGGKARADLAYTHAVPKAARSGHAVALGVDWGLNTLLSAGAAQLHPDGVITALGSGAQYRAAGVMAKQHRLRRHGEKLHAKTDQYARLIAADDQHPLISKHQVITEEIQRVADRRSHLNDALAWSAARWAVDQAIAAGAGVIYLEDLRSMEARGMGRTQNTRLSQQVRGQIAERMRHLAAEQGIAVVANRPGTLPGTARTASHACGTAKPPTARRSPAGSGRSAPTRNAAGRATATKARGAGSLHAASPTRPGPSPTAPPTPWLSAPSWTNSKPGRSSHPRPPARTGRRPDRPGTSQHALRPGDAGYPPPTVLTNRRASVRRDTSQRAGNCPEQHTGTRT
jgi:hypothetical protein